MYIINKCDVRSVRGIGLLNVIYYLIEYYKFVISVILNHNCMSSHYPCYLIASFLNYSRIYILISSILPYYSKIILNGYN